MLNTICFTIVMDREPLTYGRDTDLIVCFDLSASFWYQSSEDSERVDRRQSTLGRFGI